MKHIPRNRHTMMFSATMPPTVAKLAQRYLREPQRIDVSPPGTTASGIKHRLFMVDPMDKQRVLLALIKEQPGTTLIFVRMKSDVDALARIIESQTAEPVARMHSDMTQRDRMDALAKFRADEIRILIATDVAARGLDIPLITHVIHYDIPENAEDYVHRSGRTARHTAVGIASTIASWMNRAQIEAIEALIGNPLPRCHIAGVNEWTEKKSTPLGRPRRPKLGRAR